MGEELKRTQEALAVAVVCLQRISTLGGTSSIGNEMAREALDKMDALLAPPEEFEEVEESAGWVNIYPSKYSPSGYVCGQSRPYSTKGEADAIINNDRIGCQELRVKVKRPVKRPVVREVEAKGRIDYRGEPYGVRDYPFGNAPECHSKTGTLIFRWEESA